MEQAVKTERAAETLTREQKTDEVAALLASGVAREVIVEQCAKKWGIAGCSVPEYLTAARKQFREAAQPARAENYALAVARHESLYERALAEGQIATARAVLWQLCQLQGLDESFSIADLQAVVTLEQLLVGKPTNRTEVHEARQQIRQDPRAALRALASGASGAAS